MSTKPGLCDRRSRKSVEVLGVCDAGTGRKGGDTDPGRDSAEHRYVASRLRRISPDYQLHVRRPNFDAGEFSSHRKHRRSIVCAFCSGGPGLSKSKDRGDPGHVPSPVLLSISRVLANGTLFAKDPRAPPVPGRRAHSPWPAPMISEYTLLTSLLRRHRVGPCARH